MVYTKQEMDMARKGYVYFARTEGAGGYRKRATRIDNIPRADLVFDWPAFEAHNVTR